MDAAIRRYRVSDSAELARRVQDEFVPMVPEIPGFVAYYVVDAGDGELASITIAKTRQAWRSRRSARPTGLAPTSPSTLRAARTSSPEKSPPARSAGHRSRPGDSANSSRLGPGCHPGSRMQASRFRTVPAYTFTRSSAVPVRFSERPAGTGTRRAWSASAQVSTLAARGGTTRGSREPSAAARAPPAWAANHPP